MVVAVAEGSTVEITPIESSNITGLGWFDGLMVVEFRGGSRYLYRDVPADVFEAFMAAESKGKYFAAEIKPHADRYPFERLPKPEAA